VLHRQVTASGNMSEKLQAVSQVVTTVNYIKNNNILKGRHLAELCDDMEADHNSDPILQ